MKNIIKFGRSGIYCRRTKDRSDNMNWWSFLFRQDFLTVFTASMDPELSAGMPNTEFSSFFCFHGETWPEFDQKIHGKIVGGLGMT